MKRKERCREGGRRRRRWFTPVLIREQTKDTIIIFIDGNARAARLARPGWADGGGMSMYGIFISSKILRP